MSIKTRFGLILWLAAIVALVTVPACVQLRQKPVVELPPQVPGMVAERTVQRSVTRTPVAPPVVPRVQLFWLPMVIDPLEMPASATNYRVLVMCSPSPTRKPSAVKTNVKNSPVIIVANKEAEFFWLRVTNTYLRCSYE